MLLQYTSLTVSKFVNMILTRFILMVALPSHWKYLHRHGLRISVIKGCADSLDEEGQPGIGRGIPVFHPGDPVRHCPGLKTVAYFNFSYIRQSIHAVQSLKYILVQAGTFPRSRWYSRISPCRLKALPV
jgi:hypothetical protein